MRKRRKHNGQGLAASQKPEFSGKPPKAAPPFFISAFGVHHCLLLVLCLVFISVSGFISANKGGRGFWGLLRKLRSFGWRLASAKAAARVLL